MGDLQRYIADRSARDREYFRLRTEEIVRGRASFQAEHKRYMRDMRTWRTFLKWATFTVLTLGLLGVAAVLRITR